MTMISYQQLFSIFCELIQPCQHHLLLLISLGQPDEDHEDLFLDDDDENVDDDGETFWPAPPLQPSFMTMTMLMLLMMMMMMSIE